MRPMRGGGGDLVLHHSSCGMRIVSASFAYVAIWAKCRGSSVGCQLCMSEASTYPSSEVCSVVGGQIALLCVWEWYF